MVLGQWVLLWELWDKPWLSTGKLTGLLASRSVVLFAVRWKLERHFPNHRQKSLCCPPRAATLLWCGLFTRPYPQIVFLLGPFTPTLDPPFRHLLKNQLSGAFLDRVTGLALASFSATLPALGGAAWPGGKMQGTASQRTGYKYGSATSSMGETGYIIDLFELEFPNLSL